MENGKLKIENEKKEGDGKMKGKAGKWVMVMMVAVLMGCGGGVEEVERREGRTVMLRIGTPAGNEVEYTRATQDATEKEINSLMVYDFLVKQDPTGKGTELRVAGVQYLTKASGTGMPEAGYFISTGGGATACLSLAATVGSTHVFACVANEEYTRFDSIMQPGISPIDSLNYTPCTRILKSGESTAVLATGGMVMSGMTAPVWISDKASYSVTLQRIVARVDVMNNVSADRNFRIVSISAHNCTQSGYLFEQGSDGSATAEKAGYKKLVSLTQNTAIDAELKALATGATCGKVLYLYEHAAKSNGEDTPTPVLVLEYTLNGSPGSMQVEMKSQGQRFDIKRNRAYTLMIGDGGSVTRIACTVREEKMDGE